MNEKKDNKTEKAIEKQIKEMMRKERKRGGREGNNGERKRKTNRRRGTCRRGHRNWCHFRLVALRGRPARESAVSFIVLFIYFIC